MRIGFSRGALTRCRYCQAHIRWTKRVVNGALVPRPLNQPCEERLVVGADGVARLTDTWTAHECHRPNNRQQESSTQ